MEVDFNVAQAAVRRMQNRASCRAFTEEPIKDEILDQILRTGIRAASGGNLQPYSIIVVKDKKKNKELAELCGEQKFVGHAAINLIFLLDWYKLSRLSVVEKAPFTAPKSYMHFLIGLEDVICAAQSIETAAWQFGVGSVYIGSVNGFGKDIAKKYNLPKYTYPVVVLSMGYPKEEPSLRERLPFEMTVFEERYPDLTDQDIKKNYDIKYEGRKRKLPVEESVRKDWLKGFKEALLTTYSKEETEKIVKQVDNNGEFEFSQYVFGLHYHARDLLEFGEDILKMYKEQGLEPFFMLKNEDK